MNLRDGIGILKKAGQVAADVAMTQPGIRRRVERVQATVEVIRREVETIAAQAEARAQVLLRELQEEALRLLGQNSKSVMFMKSVSESAKAALLQSARALLYVSF